MRKPYVMASITGGHFLTVGTLSPTVSLKALLGSDLNHSGKPCTAGTGFGRIDSSSGGQRKTTLRGSASAIRSLERLFYCSRAVHAFVKYAPIPSCSVPR